LRKAHLILCDSARPTSRQKIWREAAVLPLRIGTGKDEVHLNIEHLSRTMCADVPDVAVDLLEVASYIYAADQAISRGGQREFEYGARWRRRFRFEIPVRCPDLWGQPALVSAFAELLGFLSDDDFEFAFTRSKHPRRLSEYLFNDAGAQGGGEVDEIMLFSGGQDSLGGAVHQICQGLHRVALVSHRPVSKMYARQCDLVRAIRERQPDRRYWPLHVSVEVNKGEQLTRDFTQRSRSFLFASLAAVVARLFGQNRIRFYENGVISLNFPFSPQTLGGRASRTTHPRTLQSLGRFFTLLFNEEFRVLNPFQWNTRTDVLAGIKAAGHGSLCALTSSCIRTHEMTAAQPHCGRCSQCVDRRLAALAAGLDDSEDPARLYRDDILWGPRESAHLTLIERYFGLARRVSAMQDATAFAQEFGELARVVQYCDSTPAAAAARVFELYRRHADQVCGAINAIVAQHTEALRRPDCPVNCLLRIAAGHWQARPSALPQPPADQGQACEPATWEIDDETFEVRLGKKTCFLNKSREFMLIQRLNRKPGRFVSLDALREDVWHDRLIDKNTIQRTVSRLRARLRSEGFEGIEIEGIKEGYRLLLPKPVGAASA